MECSRYQSQLRWNNEGAQAICDALISHLSIRYCIFSRDVFGLSYADYSSLSKLNVG